jgi:hypothetical protein
MKKILTISKIETLKLIGICIKSATAIIGGSLILVEGHPYLSIAILALGGVANEVVSFIKEKENEKNTTNNDTITIPKQP